MLTITHFKNHNDIKIVFKYKMFHSVTPPVPFTVHYACMQRLLFFSRVQQKKICENAGVGGHVAMWYLLFVSRRLKKREEISGHTHAGIHT